MSYANFDDGFFPPSINTLIYPATYSLSQMVPNPLYNNNVTKKEFFYNRHNLLLEFIGSEGFSLPVSAYPFQVNIDNMHFYEVDMIPFFMYTTESNVDNAIRIPWQSVAPFIDYNNVNYNFIDNNKLNITPQYISSSSSSSVFNANNSGSLFDTQ
jgi:hypothetical protein